MKHTLPIVSIMLLSNCLYSQSDFFQKPAFSISLVNHSIGIPFKDVFKKPFNFGISISADFPYGQRQFQKIEAGWYKHKNLSSAVWIKTDYVRRFQDNMGLEHVRNLGFE